MRRARVNTATVGVFSWALLEPEEGKFEFGWLDDTLDRLHANGVRVMLATPTASPPPWFTLAYPDAMPTSAGREQAVARKPGHLLRRRARLPAGGPAESPGELGRRYARSPGAGHVARAQRVRHDVLVRPRGHGASGTLDAQEPLRTPQAALERGVGHRVLGPALLVLGSSPAAAGDPVPAEPRPGAGLPPLLVRRTARRLHRAAGPAALARARHPGHHELHGTRSSSGGPLVVGAGGRRGRGRPLPVHCRTRGGARGHRVRFRLGQGGRARTAMAAAGAGPEHGRDQRRAGAPGARPDAGRQPRLRRARRRRGAVLPMARLPGRGRAVPPGTGPARRSGHAHLPRGRRARRDAGADQRGGWIHRGQRRRGAGGRRIPLGT